LAIQLELVVVRQKKRLRQKQVALHPLMLQLLLTHAIHASYNGLETSGMGWKTIISSASLAPFYSSSHCCFLVLLLHFRLHPFCGISATSSRRSSAGRPTRWHWDW